MGKIRISLAGTGSLGFPTLLPTLKNIINDDRFLVTSIMTRPDKKSRKALEFQTSEIKKIAALNNLIVHQPNKISSLKENIRNEKIDILLVVAYGEILTRDVLALANHACINIHPSLLPKYRGASPIQESLLHGDAETGITWIVMSEKMDEGDIIEQIKYSISAEDDFSSLSKKLAHIAAEKTADVIVNFIKTKQRIPQNASGASYCKKIEKENGRIDFATESARHIINKMRAYIGWPGTYFFLKGKRIKLIDADAIEQKNSPGEIIATKNELIFGTPRGSVKLKKLQPESKKVITAEEFLRGYRV